MVNPSTHDLLFETRGARPFLVVNEQDADLVFTPPLLKESPDKKPSPRRRDGQMDELRDDLNEVLVYTASALRRCDLILASQQMGHDQDTERDLHHLKARIEAMYHQWEDISRVMDRLVNRRQPEKLGR